MLVECHEDERPKPVDEQAPRREAAVEPSLQVRACVVAVHAGEARRLTREDKRPPLEDPKTERQADAGEPGKVGQGAVDLDEHVLVDRLIEAVAARAERGDDRTENRCRDRREIQGTNTTFPMFLGSRPYRPRW